MTKTPSNMRSPKRSAYDQDIFKHALSEAFGRLLDNGPNARMGRGYNQLAHGDPGAVSSGCKRGRLQQSRVRQLDDELTSEAEADECCANQRGGRRGEERQHHPALFAMSKWLPLAS